MNEQNSIVAEFCRRVQAVIWNRSLVKTEKERLGLTKDKVRPGDMVCIIFGCTVPVILRREPPKTSERIEKEMQEDRFESFRAALSTCEEACFRKLRYKRKLDSLGSPGDTDREDWKEEVQEEMVAVNKQIELWKARELEQAAQRKADEEEKTKRKNEAAERAAERKKTCASRASTFRVQPLQQKGTIGPVEPISEEEDSAPAGGDDPPETDSDEAQV